MRAEVRACSALPCCCVPRALRALLPIHLALQPKLLLLTLLGPPGYLTATSCNAGAFVSAQPALLGGSAGQQQVWRLEPVNPVWTSVVGVSIRIQVGAQ